MTNKKSKKIKLSPRGITFSDAQLFPVGTNYKYIVDQRNQKITILPSNNREDNVVSRKKRKNGYIPLIDIRNNKRNIKAIQALEGCTHLQVTIDGETVVVEGYVEESSEKKESVFSQITQKVKNTFKKKETTLSNNVVDITNVLNVKKKLTVVLSREELSKVAGEQLSLFDQFSWDIATENGTSSIDNISDIQSSLGDSIVPLQVASMFSGAGIMDLGFKEAGFDLKFALELDADAVMTYKYNLGDHIIQADATEFDRSRIPQVPVMIAGSPCKPYSNANRIKRLLDHPDNRLYMNFLNSVKENPNCKVWVLENVPQIASSEGAFFKEEIMNEMSDFEVTVGILNSADFGAAQVRKRAIFIGSKIGKIELPEAYYEPSEYKTVGDAFTGLHTFLPNFFDWSKPKKETVERMKYVPQGGNFSNIPPEIRKGSHSNYHARLDWNKPSITIVNPRKSLITHPFENRIISIREAARLFGVPDDFTFLGKINAMQQQICNAVPVQLSKAVATVIKNAIAQFNIRNRANPISTF